MDEPCMSDKTLLVSVEDLICMAMGPQETNVVDFKLVQTILHILARQMRLLEQKVVVEVGELPPPTKLKPPKQKDTSTSQSTSDSDGKTRESRKKKRVFDDIKEEGKGRDKSTDKEKAKTEKEAIKEPKEKEKEQKKKDKGQEKMTKEQEKKEKEEAKKAKKAEEAAQKEKEKADKAAMKDAKKGKGAKGDKVEKSPIGIKEVNGKGKEKVLVVEKGPTTRGAEAGRRDSIEVVTQSQFALLEAAVNSLKEKAGPLPAPHLPGNEQLRADLAQGNVSLTDAMLAMQVSARVQAAEQAIGRLGGLLTALAAAGAIPEDATGTLADGREVTLDGNEDEANQPRSRPSSTSRKSVAIHAGAKSATSQTSAAPAGSQAAMGKRQSVAATASRMSTAGAGLGQTSVTSRVSMAVPLVSQREMTDALLNLRDELMKNMQTIANRALSAADSASMVAKSVAEKLDVALRLDSRITTLNALVADYADQLSGFDAGLTTQMQSFQEQMTQMRGDLNSGLKQLDNANNNAETAAVMELTERYDLLVADLDHTLLAHQALTTFQQQLSIDFRSLFDSVEMLREQKADRDEVLDGLRDKADNERLAGLLREVDFEQARAELERRLELCHEKFRRQDLVWVEAMKDLAAVVQTKAELMDLLKTRDETTQQLQQIQDMIKKLALVLGEPKAAILTRKLARGALCAACMVPALMEPEDLSSGQPPPLPAARGAPVGAEAPCAPEWRPPESPELRTHTCRRWVGGSHTLLTATSHARAPPPPELPATTIKYVGLGGDGRLYMMEKEMQPCLECNPLEPEAGAGDGGADQPQGTGTFQVTWVR